MVEVVATWLARTSATVLPAGAVRDANSTSDPATQTLASTTGDASTSSKTTSACKLTPYSILALGLYAFILTARKVNLCSLFVVPIRLLNRLGYGVIIT